MTTPPTTPQMPPPIEASKKSGAGSIIGAVIIIIVIIFGGLYFWGAQLEKDQMMQEELPFLLGDDTLNTDGIPPVSTSDEVADIEADANATDIAQFEAQLDNDLGNVETQL